MIINIPTPTSHDGWEMIDNQIQTITGERRGVYIYTGITNNCGFSVNFSAFKDFEAYDDLYVSDGSKYIFRMFHPNNTWENYSGTSYNINTISEIKFVGKSGDANVSPFTYFKDITYSHFPYYDELVESLND